MPHQAEHTDARLIVCKFAPPSKLWPYDYITQAWKDLLNFKGVGDKRIKSFLSEEKLVNGSSNGGVETRWSEGQEFWEAIIQASGQKGFFFSGEAIDELCNMLAEQCEQVAKSAIKPGQFRRCCLCCVELTWRFP